MLRRSITRFQEWKPLDKDQWSKVIKAELRAKVLEMVEDGKKIEYIRLFIFRYFEKILENGQPTAGRLLT